MVDVMESDFSYTTDKLDRNTREVRFNSEAILQEAIAGLLEIIEHVQGVQILQGQQEYGKDIIFWARGPVHELIPCACVIKNIKISGTVGSSKDARTILFQAEQALDTPFIDATGAEFQVYRVYVLSIYFT